MGPNFNDDFKQEDLKIKLKPLVSVIGSLFAYNQSEGILYKNERPYFNLGDHIEP